MALSSLKTARFIALETFYPDGKGVITPVWMTYEDDKVYVWTDAESWKVRRILDTPRVRLCASDAKGSPTPGSAWVEGRARILDDADSFKAQQQRMARKYGVLFWLFFITAKLRKTEGVVIEISEPGPFQVTAREGRGCLATAARVMLALLLTALIAWVVWMFLKKKEGKPAAGL